MSFKYSKFYNRNTDLTREKMHPTNILDTNIHLSGDNTRKSTSFNDKNDKNDKPVYVRREPTRVTNKQIRTTSVKKQVPKLDDKFICKFDPNDKHLYKNNARVLPCNNIACTDCIQKFMDVNTGILKCNLCTNEHRISNIKHLQVDPHLVISMDKNKVNIGEDLLQQLRFYLDQLIS